MKSDSARAGRLAAALKENLKRRKAQARRKSQGTGLAPAGEAGAEPLPQAFEAPPAIGPKAAPKHG